MSIKTLPPTLVEAHALIEQLQWRVGQLEKQIYGPKSERAPSTEENLSKEQILMSLFPPPAEPSTSHGKGSFPTTRMPLLRFEVVSSCSTGLGESRQ